MKIRSHVQVPKSIILNFSFKDYSTVNGKKSLVDKVYIYDIKHNKIQKRKVKYYGTIKGYYSKEIEDLLKDEYETPFGDFKKRIFDFVSNKTNKLFIGENDFIQSKKILECLFFRNNDLAKSVNNSEHTIISVSPDDIVRYGHYFGIAKIDDFDKYSMVLLLTRTNEKFLNNISGFTMLSFKNELRPDFFVPICEKGGLCFYYKPNDEYSRETMVLDECDVNKINAITLSSEKATGKNSIFASDKETILKAIDRYKKL